MVLGDLSNCSLEGEPEEVRTLGRQAQPAREPGDSGHSRIGLEGLGTCDAARDLDANITAAWLRGLIDAILDALKAILRWNVDRDMVFRLTSNSTQEPAGAPARTPRASISTGSRRSLPTSEISRAIASSR